MKIKFNKSISTRYMIIFMAIMTVTALILGITIASIIGSFSLDTKKEDLSNANIILKDSIDSIEIGDDIEGAIKDNEQALIDTLSVVNLTIPNTSYLIVDKDGVIVAYLNDSMRQNEEILYGPAILEERNLVNRLRISSNDISYIEREGDVSMNNTLDGVFTQRVVLFASHLTEDGETVGYLISYYHGIVRADMIQEMLTSVIITIIWITVVSLVLIYGVGYRSMEPLREISIAAKSFSRGDYSVRVRARGNSEIAQLADSFNKMAMAIETKDDMQRTFLSNVSHDLKTPMTTIAGFIDGILDGAIPKEKESYYLNIIKKEVSRLNRLVNSLLDLSRMQSGNYKYEMKPFNVCELARQTVISLENEIAQKNLDVQFDTEEFDIIAIGDKDSINRVIYNLCHNAIKFSNDGGRYEISITKEGSKVRFTMYNEGTGIPSEDIPHIFERFYKSDKSRGLDKSGVGLGLFISKTIMDAHGEELSVESEHGKWCKFTFTLSKGE